MGELTDTFLKRGRLKDGVYDDGDRLFLRVKTKGGEGGEDSEGAGSGSGVGSNGSNGAGKRVWFFIYKSPTTGKRREMGLGAYPSVGLSVARKLAQDARDKVSAGIDPVNDRRNTKLRV